MACVRRTSRYCSVNGRLEVEFQKKSIVKLCRPADLKGVVALYHSGVFLNQFHDFLPIGTNDGQRVMLDGSAAGFRDDFICIKVYAVSPGAEDQIPIMADIGPRVLYLVKQTFPWLAVEVYQQTVALAA
jgi:hypothetical protein